MSWSWSADPRRSEQKSGDYFGGCGREGTVKVSFSGVSEGEMLWLRTGKGTAQHVAPIKERRTAFNTVNMENQQGSGGQTLD